MALFGFTTYLVSILLIVVCSIGVSYHNQLATKTCDNPASGSVPAGNGPCANNSSPFYIIILVSLIVGCIPLGIEFLKILKDIIKTAAKA